MGSQQATCADVPGSRPPGRSLVTCPTCERIFASALARCPIDGADLVSAVGRIEKSRGSAERADELAVGQLVGEYVIEARIGRGGMGSVYRATHPMIGSRVAIKVIANKHAHDHAAVARFVQEARASNRIRHRNIIDVFAIGHLPDGRVYCVMEHLDGISLSRHLGSTHRMPLDEALSMLEQLARALDAAHVNGVIHRDVKPGNIFLVHDETGQMFVKLLDFGIAKLDPSSDAPIGIHTQTGTIIGTPAYMAPEQCRGKGIGPASDIYSLGVVAYQALTGALPFPGSTIPDLYVQQQTERPAPASTRAPDLSSAIDAVLERALHVDPAKRYQTAASFVRALADAASQAPGTVVTEVDREEVPARPSSMNALAGPRRRPSMRWAAGGCAIALAVIIATVVWSPGPIENTTPDITAAPMAMEPPATVQAEVLPEVARTTAVQERSAKTAKPARNKQRRRAPAVIPIVTPARNANVAAPRAHVDDVIADMPVRF